MNPTFPTFLQQRQTLKHNNPMKSNKELYLEYKNGILSIERLALYYNVSYFEMQQSIRLGELEMYKEAMDMYYPVRKITYVVDYILNEDDIPQRIFIEAENADKAVGEFFGRFPSCTMLSCVEAWEKGLQEPVLVDR